MNGALGAFWKACIVHESGPLGSHPLPTMFHSSIDPQLWSDPVTVSPQVFRGTLIAPLLGHFLPPTIHSLPLPSMFPLSFGVHLEHLSLGVFKVSSVETAPSFPIHMVLVLETFNPSCL